MHELPVVKEILAAVLACAEDEGAAQVTKVVLEIGDLHDLDSGWVDKFFHFASRGTVAETAEVVIEKPPLISRCNDCKEHFVLHIRSGDPWNCPLCGSGDIVLLTGKEFSIKTIEMI